MPTGYVTTPSNGKWVLSKYTAPVPPTPEQPEGEVEQRPDGSTVTKPDGSRTVAAEAADGANRAEAFAVVMRFINGPYA